MKTFRDNQGNEWTIDLNVGACRRLKDRLDLDLLSSDDRVFGDQLQRLSEDIVLLVDALYVLVEPQCRERGLSDEQFAERMGGEAIESACDALAEALADFFQNPNKRRVRKALLEKIRIFETTLTDRALQKIEDQTLTEEEADKLIDQALAAGPSFTNSPASSESTPAPSHSDS